MSLTLDPTGSASANLITGEAHPVVASDELLARYIFPIQGPFYATGVVVSYTDSRGAVRTLTKDVDYQLIFEMRAGPSSSNNIYGAIHLKDATILGSCAVTYQAVGGNWVINQAQIQKYLNENSFNPALAYLSLQPWPDVTYPASSNVWTIDSEASLAAIQTAYPYTMLGAKILLRPINERVYNSGAQRTTGAGVVIAS